MTLRALSTAATGMHAQSTNVDVIANNLANVNTHGFKKQKAIFEDLLYQQIRSVGTLTSNSTRVPTGLQVGLGTNLLGLQRQFEEQGSLDQTNRKLDLAIQGDGFFQVTVDSDGNIGYMRAGGFTRDANGLLLDPNGHPLEPQITIPITVPIDTIGISDTGLVQYTTATGTTIVGQIRLARFSNPEGLRAQGNNYFLKTLASGDPTEDVPGQQGLGLLAQGALEASNVDLVKELTDMIKAQRAYEINSESIKTADEMLQTAGSLRR